MKTLVFYNRFTGNVMMSQGGEVVVADCSELTARQMVKRAPTNLALYDLMFAAEARQRRADELRRLRLRRWEARRRVEADLSAGMLPLHRDSMLANMLLGRARQ